MHCFKLTLTLATLLCAGSSIVSAQTVIPVTNASFEAPLTAPITMDPVRGNYNTTIPGWTGLPGGSSFGESAFTNVPYPGGLPNGTQAAYINSGGVFQNVAATLLAGSTYTVSGYIGQRTDYTGTGNISLETVGGTLLATSPAFTPTPGTFQLTTFSFTPLATNPNLGQSLRLTLRVASGIQSDFDVVGLTVFTPVPEPSAVAFLACSAMTGATFLRRRKLARKSA